MCSRIMFVDDEQNVLSAINRMFFDDEDYELCLASGGKQAIQMLREQPVKVIVSDMRMPVMNGVEFLKEAKKICPDAVRIILSGQSDVKDVMNSINNGGIWRFISKPWNDADMKMTIKNALELYAKEMERRELLVKLKEKNESLKNLNNELETKVLERTRIIRTQNEMLNLLLNSSDFNEVMQALCNSLSEISGQDSYLYYCFDKERIVESGSSPDEYTKNALKRALKGEHYQGSERLHVLPVKKSEEILGSVAFVGSKSNSDTLKEIDTQFSPILALALSQQKALFNAPDLLKNLDDLF
ncbi:response regulator [Chitinispirillales bacterium ANBcel5]|uniref:response regulator n=1 Tax=Cellulosispirillum alkaliphilum TaxID=3039283 RepID=UPI002A5357FA|nr:response regulator [Chitinispirillales bacterium ANBcel5]